MWPYFYTYPAIHIIGRGLAAVLEVNVGNRLPRSDLHLSGVHTNVGTKLALRGVFRQYVLFLSVPHRFLSGFSRFPCLASLFNKSHEGQDDSPCCRPVWPSKEAETNSLEPSDIGQVFLRLLFASFR